MGVILGKTEHIKYKKKKSSLLVVLHFPALLVTDLQVVKTLSDRLIYQRTVVATCNIVYQTEYICMVFIRHLTLLLPFVVQYHFT